MKTTEPCRKTISHADDAAPTVSVVMPAYRVSQYIAAALDSVLNQTLTDYEIIVVNDGSPDSEELERELGRYRNEIIYIKQDNRGCSAARNAGIKAARGRLVAFLDADDYWKPEYLAEQVKFLQDNPSIDMVYTDGLLVGDSALAGRTFMQATPSRGEATLEALLRARCTVLLSGTLVRRQAILEAGLFDEELRCSEDYDLWLRLTLNGRRLAYRRKVLVCKRIHAAGLSADRVNLHEHALRVLQKTSLDERLNKQERQGLSEMEARLKAAIQLECGKQRLSAGDFAAAASEIESALGFKRRWKLQLMLFWLRYSPRALLHIYNFRTKLTNEEASLAFESGASFTARAGWLFFAKCFAFGLSFILPLLLVRRLSQHEFGLYKQVFLIVGTAIYILPLGFGMSAFYFLPRERERRSQVVFNIFLFYLLMGSSACLALVLRPALLTAIFNSGEIAAYAPRIGLLILFWVVSSFLEIAALANQESRLATFFIIVSQLAKTTFLLAAAISLASVAGVIDAAIMFGILQTILLILYLRSRFGSFWRKIDWGMVRTQTAYALPIGLASVLFQVQMDLHNYFVSHRFSTTEFAIYAVGCFNLPLIGILSESVASVTIPHVSYLQKVGRHREIIELVSRMMRKLAAIYFPIYLFLLVTAREFITVLFTARYEASWPIFAINLTLIPLALIASACDPVIRAYAEHRYFMMKIRAVVIAALSIALWIGIGHFGLIGAITVVVAFNLIERCVIAAKVGCILGVTRRDMGLLKDIGKLAAAASVAAAGALLMRLYWADANALLLLIVCGSVFCLIYAAALVVFGVLTPEERDFIERRFIRLPQFSWSPPAVPVADAGIMGVSYGVWSAQAAPSLQPTAADASPILTRNASLAIKVGELTQKQYWDDAHISEKEMWQNRIRFRNASRGFASLKNFIKRILGRRLLEYMGSYEEFLLWNVIYEKYMPKKTGAKVLEVGSAPGDFLVRLSETFDFIPFGIEYSKDGVELNRQIFAENHINPTNVIHGDFLSDEFHQRYQGQFDIVISRGFIEHFTDAKDIVEKHANLVAKGGLLIISIPNLRGFNYLLARTFHKEVIAMHNLTIMRKKEFNQLFDAQNFSLLYCNHYGTFNFALLNTSKNVLLQILLSLCLKLQVLLNVSFRMLLGKRGAESRFFSPSLIYIGLKKE